MSVPSHESTWTRGAPHMPASCRLNTWPASRMRIESKMWQQALTADREIVRYASYASYVRISAGAEGCRIDQCSDSHMGGEYVGEKIITIGPGGGLREGNLLYRGELFAIYVLKGHQRRGVGRRLFSAMARHFIGRRIMIRYMTTSENPKDGQSHARGRRLLYPGWIEMLLWVLEDNHPARQFYELMGGEYVEQKTITITGGTDLMTDSAGDTLDGWQCSPTSLLNK